MEQGPGTRAASRRGSARRARADARRLRPGRRAARTQARSGSRRRARRIARAVAPLGPKQPLPPDSPSAGQRGLGIVDRDVASELRVAQRARTRSSIVGEAISSNAPCCHASGAFAGLPSRERRPEMPTLGSMTARTRQRRRVACCASTASSAASSSSTPLRTSRARSWPALRRGGRADTPGCGVCLRRLGTWWSSPSPGSGGDTCPPRTRLAGSRC